MRCDAKNHRIIPLLGLSYTRSPRRSEHLRKAALHLLSVASETLRRFATTPLCKNNIRLNTLRLPSSIAHHLPLYIRRRSLFWDSFNAQAWSYGLTSILPHNNNGTEPHLALWKTHHISIALSTPDSSANSWYNLPIFALPLDRKNVSQSRKAAYLRECSDAPIWRAHSNWQWNSMELTITTQPILPFIWHVFLCFLQPAFCW